MSNSKEEPQIVAKPALTVVGLEAAFIHALSPDATNALVIGALWNSFVRRAAELQHRVGNAMYGVIHERPKPERSHPDELQYIAAVAVSSASDVPVGMVGRMIPASTFAVFVHRGPITKIAETCRYIYRDWLPQSAWQHSGIADIERYDDRFDCESENSEMEYWVSVKPKSPVEVVTPLPA